MLGTTRSIFYNNWSDFNWLWSFRNVKNFGQLKKIRKNNLAFISLFNLKVKTEQKAEITLAEFITDCIYSIVGK